MDAVVPILILYATGLPLLWLSQAFRRTHKRATAATQGIVSGVSVPYGDRDRPVVDALVVYHDARGKRFEMPMHCPAEDVREGQQVRVRYDPDDPRVYMIDAGGGVSSGCMASLVWFLAGLPGLLMVGIATLLVILLAMDGCQGGRSGGGDLASAAPRAHRAADRRGPPSAIGDGRASLGRPVPMRSRPAAPNLADTGRGHRAFRPATATPAHGLGLSAAALSTTLARA